ncbi:diguanylate cyclase (GGDEF)-like protein [Catenuloplanes nepalensis]|uniref:Diguanylate cyclase (GGDEF)-like protein n=1 Tax=Catenuloplanes nepalensis TaxID=587533 RepID=A0ABT9MP68_9ACTN|nr:GGDEF domain-containing protein [Catenuloplanes nepalensis]MDP9793215.1 diguanylate cyclase (GGDEF)-like protein [Catenuloplanes nepalensis]
MRRNVSVLLAVAVAAGVLVQLVLPGLTTQAGSALVYLSASAAVTYALVGCLRHARAERGRIRAGWWAGVVTDALLAAAYLLGGLSGVLGRPELAGLAVVVAVPAAMTAVVMLWLHAAPPDDRFARLIQMVDIAAVASALFMVAWHFVLGPVAAVLPESARLSLLALMLPNIVSLAAALVFVSRTEHGRHLHALSLFLCALAVIVVSQTIAVYNQAHQLPWYSYGAGGGPFVGGILAALAAHASLPETDATGRRWFSGAWVLLPYVPTGLALCGVVGLYARHGTLSPALTWTLLVTVGLAFVRQFLGLMFVRGLLRRMDEQQAMLHHQANHDLLTGLPNRGAFYHRLAAELAEAGPDTCAGVLMLDLDDFKPVNDTFGHAAGDTLLVEVSRRLSDCLRDDDIAARLGGDEFVVLLPRLDEPDAAEAVAARVADRLAAPMSIVPGHTTFVRASIGIATVTGDAYDPDWLLHQADMALYAAKAAGKGLIRRCGPEATAGRRRSDPAPAEASAR